MVTTPAATDVAAGADADGAPALGSSVLRSFSLQGRVAVVTGSRRGLGRAIACALAEAGADVGLIDRGCADGTAAEVRARGARVHQVTRDLATASPESLHAAVDEIADVLGGPDVLVNNAGTIKRTAAREHSVADWDEVLSVNLDAVFHLSQAAGRRMLDRGWGRIIMMASMLTFQGGIRVPGYTASKHAVAGLAKALATEWAGGGVTVNAIAPGYMSTDNTEALRADPVRHQAILDRIPLGRWGDPRDLAGAVVFLASDASAYVTGSVLPVDGGWLVR